VLGKKEGQQLVLAASPQFSWRRRSRRRRRGSVVTASSAWVTSGFLRSSRFRAGKRCVRLSRKRSGSGKRKEGNDGVLLWASHLIDKTSSMSWARLLTQNLHPASSTQQAEQASFTREQIPRCASQFSLKINKRQSS
jgi:hypothetical protein